MSRSDWLSDDKLAELEDIAFLRSKSASVADLAKLVEHRDWAAKHYLKNLVIEVRERREAEKNLARTMSYGTYDK